MNQLKVIVKEVGQPLSVRDVENDASKVHLFFKGIVPGYIQDIPLSAELSGYILIANELGNQADLLGDSDIPSRLLQNLEHSNVYGNYIITKEKIDAPEGESGFDSLDQDEILRIIEVLE